MLYSKTMMMHILSVASGQLTDIPDHRDHCKVPGSVFPRISTEKWTKRTELCDADHVWNYAELGPEAGLNAKSWGQTHVRCKDGKLISSPGLAGVNPNVSTRLCLDKSKVDAREKRLAELFDASLQSKIAEHGVVRMNVIARATASRRDPVTGKEQDTEDWDNMVVALRQYFEEDIPRWVNGRLDVTQVQRFSLFKGMQIMPDEKEGEFALKAIEVLAASGTDPISEAIREKQKEGLLISMEQGGRSLQIWPGQDRDNDVYPEETGLYSNLGNNAIKAQLRKKNPNSACINPVVTPEEKRTQPLPKSYFDKEACRKELRALPKHRHDTDSEGMPKLVDGGLYVAFSTLYYAASNSNIAGQVMTVEKALKAVTDSLEDGTCPEEHVAVLDPAKHWLGADKLENLCMQRLVLEMMLEQMLEKSEGIKAEIVFVKKIDGKKLTWAVGMAETMKPTVRPGQHIVVLDVGSSATKVYGMAHNRDGKWSDMQKWAENEDGDLVFATKPEDSMQLRI